MGTYLWSCAVDLDKLSKAFGSKNKALARKAIVKVDVEDNAKWFSHHIEKGAPRLDQAIQEIIDGKVTAPKHAFQYVYALEAIAKVLGTPVGDELKMGMWIEELLDPLLKKVGGKPFCKAMGLDKPKAPMPIPKTKVEPFCGTLTPAEIAPFLGALARVKLRAKKEPPDAEWGDTLDYVLGELNARLGGASKRRRGLVNLLY
jgi:hypothetical protein